MPPPLNKVEDINDWIRELEIWQCVTDLESTKQGPAIYLSLSQKIRQECADISVNELNAENGVTLLINKLKDLYAKDTDQLSYTAYEQFETFCRPIEMNLTDYINEFERLYNKIKVYKMELPTGVLAYRMLKSANISEEKQQLVRATLDALTYEDMKKKLKAIHNIISDDNDMKIKLESTYLSNQEEMNEALY